MTSNPVTIKFENHKNGANILFEQSLKMVKECNFNNLKEVIVRGELLFKKVEEMDIFDLSDYPELRQNRKDLIKKLQELISKFDRYPKSVETFKKLLVDFHNDCKHYIELLELSESCDLSHLKKYELYNSLASVDHKHMAQKIQNYRQPFILFEPITKDMKVDHDNALNLIRRLFSLVVNIATVYEPMKRELPTITQHNLYAHQYLSQVEQLLGSGKKYSNISVTRFSENETFPQSCASLISNLEISYQSLNKFCDTRLTKEILSRHLESTSGNMKKLEFLRIIFILSPVFSNVCEELKYPSISALSSCVNQLEDCKSLIDTLIQLEEQSKTQLGEFFTIEITKAISFYQHVSNQAISILSKFKDLETNTNPNIW